LSAGDQGLIPC